LRLRITAVASAAAVLLALVVALGSSDTVHAGTFNPDLTLTLSGTDADAPRDVTFGFNVPSGDVNFAAIVNYWPSDWQITKGGDIPLGTGVGQLDAIATLGLINGPCDNVLELTGTAGFPLKNASIDINNTLEFLDESGGTDEFRQDWAEDLDGNGNIEAVDKYPAFINRLITDESDNPQQPIRRSAGTAIVAGVDVLIQYLIYDPGTFISKNLPNDASLGYPSVILLQNIGDPDAVAQPGTITDFCSPLTSTAINKGMADDGTVLYRNPGDGKYTFTVIAVGQADTDGDGAENGLDVCPLTANQGDPRIKGDGDLDEDGLDAACDPNDDPLSGGTNSDQDLDGYLNRQDNCPTVANGENETGTPAGNQEDNDVDAAGDRQPDQIGDACDPNATTFDGEPLADRTVTLTKEVVIGTGVTPGQTPTPGTTPTASGGGGGPVDTGVGALAPAAASIPGWAAVASGLGGAGLLGSLGTFAARLFRRRDD